MDDEDDDVYDGTFNYPRAEEDATAPSITRKKRISKSGKMFVVIGLGYGDEGKGTIVDYLDSTYGPSACVRINGGSQAAHNVVTNEGKHFCFSQVCSNMLSPFRTSISIMGYSCIIDPLTMMEEVDQLSKIVPNVEKRLYISVSCPIITPYHVFSGRVKEVLRDNKLGTVGCGVGDLISDISDNTYDSITIRDISRFNFDKLDIIRERKVESISALIESNKNHPKYDYLSVQLNLLKSDSYMGDLKRNIHTFKRRFSNNFVSNTDWTPKILGMGVSAADADKLVICEGAQGALLDVSYGFSPYITKTNSVLKGDTNIGISANYRRVGHKRVIGVIRTLMTRHGPGPFVTEEPKLKEILNEKHNVNNEWQGPFRVGWPDLVALKYAVDANGGVDCLALTHYDILRKMKGIKVCIGYNFNGYSDQHDKYFSGKKSGYYKRMRLNKNTMESIPTRTDLLFQATPVYKTITGEGWERAFIMLLEEHLGIPIDILSAGPRAIDKIELNSVFNFREPMF